MPQLPFGPAQDQRLSRRDRERDPGKDLGGAAGAGEVRSRVRLRGQSGKAD